MFLLREYDLERLKRLLFDREVVSIGLEVEWRQGESFLVDGLMEELDEKTYFCPVFDIQHYWFVHEFPQLLPGYDAEELMISGFRIVYKKK